MNKERMNATELSFYLWLFFCHEIVPAVYALGRVNRDIMREMNDLTNFQASNKTDSVQHCMQLFMMLLVEVINFKLQKNFSVKR